MKQNKAISIRLDDMLRVVTQKKLQAFAHTIRRRD